MTAITPGEFVRSYRCAHPSVFSLCVPCLSVCVRSTDCSDAVPCLSVCVRTVLTPSRVSVSVYGLFPPRELLTSPPLPPSGVCQDYKKANLEFADMTIRALELMYSERGAELAQADEAPLVWIHDYHLMLAANTIRQVRLSC